MIIFFPVPVTQEGPPQINWIHMWILIAQVIIAVASFLIAWNWYRGAAERGKEGLDAQKDDVELKIRQAYGAVESMICSLTESVTKTAYRGTRGKAYLTEAEKALTESGPEVDKIRQAIRGVEDGVEIMPILESIEEQILRYTNATTHDIRVRLCSELDSTGEQLVTTWRAALDTRLQKLKR